MNTIKKKFTEVVVGLPVEKPFHYAVPENLSSVVEVGKRVLVPFKDKILVGYIVGFVDKPEIPNPKNIHSVLDEKPILDSDMLELTKWMADYYFCSWGEAIEAALPSGVKKGKISMHPRKKDLFLEQEYQTQDKLKLTSEQTRALKSIHECLLKNKTEVFLLHGITGSGKTEVYLQAISWCLENNKSSIVLVPEISLTPQTVERFKSRFSEEVAVLHSRLLESQRFLEWNRIKDGQAKIVVGARSAVFAPVKNLGLIVVDEEHDTSYKQQDVPRYNAVDVAIMRAKIQNSIVILGSATPSLESYYKTKTKVYKLIRLKERVAEKLLPSVSVVDMRQQIRIKRQRSVIFSNPLEDGIRKQLGNKQQIMLFLNRRGFATFINCRSCGFVMKCKRCNVALNYHFDTKKLICHYCNYQLPPPNICPSCKSHYVRYFGIGTQKVESEAHRLFPQARISRLDTDSAIERTAHIKILTEFKNGNIDILVGTQMIAKGLDFPKVTFVGVIAADVTLNLPDFRASERTFQLLTQVAGRAGRGDMPGYVIIQTYTPGHYSIVAAKTHDYLDFYKKEIRQRRQLDLPPFSNIVSIILRARNEERASFAAEKLAERLRKDTKSPPKKSAGSPSILAKKRIEVIGPAQMPIYRLRGYFRQTILLKGKNVIKINDILRRHLPEYKFRRYSGALLAIDVDPR